jgi:uncharacterized protein
MSTVTLKAHGLLIVVAIFLAAGCTEVVAPVENSESLPALSSAGEQVEPSLTAVRVATRDGVTLVGDIFLPPDSMRPAPVILELTPYGRGPGFNNFRDEAAYWIQHGYAFAIFDSRGQGDSTGDYEFFAREGEDAYDLIGWLAAQAWSQDRVAMRGGSYTGTNQWFAARARPPQLRCITPNTAYSHPLRELLPYQGGAFNLRWALVWISALSDSGIEGFQEIDWARVAQHRPLATVDEAVFGRPLSLFRRFLAHPVIDDYWQSTLLTSEDYAAIDIPSLAFSGWFDGTLPGTVEHFVQMRRHSPARERQFLVIGPWEHMSAPDGGHSVFLDYAPVRNVGGFTFPGHAFLPGREITRQFFDWCLAERGEFEHPPVRLYLTGSDRWLELDHYPPADARFRSLYLAPAEDGVPSGSVPAAGRLQWDRPEVPSAAEYVYDPTADLPDFALELATAGPIDLSPLLTRDDGLVYLSAPLEVPLTVVGDVTLVLHAVTDAQDTDWIARLEDVAPDGTAIKLGSGKAAVLRARYRHGFDREVLVEPGRPEQMTLEFFAIAHTFGPGHRLRLSIRSSGFPWFSLNPNTGEPIATDVSTPRPARQTVLHGQGQGSHLRLPVLPTP